MEHSGAQDSVRYLFDRFGFFGWVLGEHIQSLAHAAQCPQPRVHVHVPKQTTLAGTKQAAFLFPNSCSQITVPK